MSEVGKKEVLIEMEAIYKVSVAVTGAVKNSDDVWVASFGAGADIVLTATTNDGTVTWTCDKAGVVTTTTGGSLTLKADDATNVLPYGQVISVKASTARSLEHPVVKVLLLPTISALTLMDNHYAFNKNGTDWYALSMKPLVGDKATDFNCTFKATTAPDNAAAWSHLSWSATRTLLIVGSKAINLYTVDKYGNQASIGTMDNMRALRLHETRDVTTMVQLKSDRDGTGAVSKGINVVNPTTSAGAGALKLELQSFAFAGDDHFLVTKEKDPHLKNLYTDTWTKGAKAAPQGYAANGKMKLTAPGLKLLNAAGQDTTIYVQATPYFPLVTGAIAGKTVGVTFKVPNGTAKGATVALPDLDFAKFVPDQVMINNPLRIFWELSADNSTWAPLAVTETPVYVTAAKPVYTTEMVWDAAVEDADLNSAVLKSVCTYDSLLAISCQAVLDFAAGATAQAGVRDAVARAFSDSVNPNMRMQLLDREGTGVKTLLGYWLEHDDPNAPVPAQQVNDQIDLDEGGNVFTNEAGNVACGAWADLLITMWALHGIGNAHKIAVDTNTGLDPDAEVFLVKNWTYDASVAMSNTAATHEYPGEASPAQVVDGQNNAASPNWFNNHFIVYDATNNSYYDPSYGTTAADPKTWVTSSADGLLTDNLVDGEMAGYATKPGANIVPNDKVVTFRDLTDGTFLWQ
ncbi:MAG: hypothetical protein EP335_17055 [Alphaproteobacteria bacterium]|nr:MAG: hypothetical protein EP335_17055 [Alphaproteobacteria bacterium]